MDYSRTSGGYNHPSTSTWGGNILLNASSGAYHMWVAEMKPADPATGAGSCGLTTWASNSQITHVSSPALGGPYARQEVAVEVWSHNPIVRAAPDGALVMWHIGSGGSAANSTPPLGYCARNGTSPCGEQDFDHCGPPAPSPDALWKAAQVGDEAEVRRLLSLGFDVSGMHSYIGTSTSPLHEAVEHHHLAVAEVLLEAGADIEARDSYYKQSPLLMAVMMLVMVMVVVVVMKVIVMTVMMIASVETSTPSCATSRRPTSTRSTIIFKEG
jgi:hypothetical protein